MLNRITLQVGNSAMGAWDNNEKPSKMNSCLSCFIIVGVLVRKLVGGDIVILSGNLTSEITIKCEAKKSDPPVMIQFAGVV